MMRLEMHLARALTQNKLVNDALGLAQVAQTVIPSGGEKSHSRANECNNLPCRYVYCLSVCEQCYNSRVRAFTNSCL